MINNNNSTIVNDVVFHGENIKLFAYYLKKYSGDKHFPDLLQSALERFEQNKHLYDSTLGELSTYIAKICQSSVSVYFHKFALPVSIPRHCTDVRSYSAVYYDGCIPETRDNILNKNIDDNMNSTDIQYNYFYELKPIVLSIFSKYFKSEKTYNIAKDLFFYNQDEFKSIASKYNVSTQRVTEIHAISIAVCQAHVNEHNDLTLENHLQKRIDTMTMEEIEKEIISQYFSLKYTKSQLSVLYPVSRDRIDQLTPKRKPFDIYLNKLGCSTYEEACDKLHEEYTTALSTNISRRRVLSVLTAKYNIARYFITDAIIAYRKRHTK